MILPSEATEKQTKSAVERIDHPTATSLEDWQDVAAGYRAEGVDVFFGLDAETGRICLYKGVPGDELNLLTDGGLLEEWLVDGPDRIREVAYALAASRLNLATYERTVRRLELETKAEVAREVGEDGKPRFKNEDARAAEVGERLRASPAAVTLNLDLDALRAEIGKREIDLAFERDRFSGAKAIARLVAATPLEE